MWRHFDVIYMLNSVSSFLVIIRRDYDVVGHSLTDIWRQTGVIIGSILIIIRRNYDVVGQTLTDIWRQTGVIGHVVTKMWRQYNHIIAKFWPRSCSYLTKFVTLRPVFHVLCQIHVVIWPESGVFGQIIVSKRLEIDQSCHILTTIWRKFAVVGPILTRIYRI